MRIIIIFYLFIFIQLVSSLVKRVSEEEWQWALDQVAAESDKHTRWVVSTYTSPGGLIKVGPWTVDNGHHEVVAYPIDDKGDYIKGRKIMIMDLQVEWTPYLTELHGKSYSSIMLKDSWTNPVPKSKDGVEWTKVDTFTTHNTGCTPVQMLEAYSSSMGNFKDGQTYFRADRSSNCHGFASTVIGGLKSALL